MIGLILDHYGCDFEMGRQRSWKEERRSHLNLNDEPLEKRTGLGFGLGSSNSLKKAWCSTQIFQKDLQKSRLAIRNSRVSWNELWKLREHLQYEQASKTRYRDTLLTGEAGAILQKGIFHDSLAFRLNRPYPSFFETSLTCLAISQLLLKLSFPDNYDRDKAGLLTVMWIL